MHLTSAVAFKLRFCARIVHKIKFTQRIMKILFTFVCTVFAKANSEKNWIFGRGEGLGDFGFFPNT